MGDFRSNAHDARQFTVAKLREKLASKDRSYEADDLKYVSPLARLGFQQMDVRKTPEECARESPGYSPEWGEPRKHATALRRILTKQIGRPVYERIPRVYKPDLADTLVAVEEGVDPGDSKHIHLSLPEGTESYLTDPPDREGTPECWFDAIADFPNIDNQFSGWVSENQPPDRQHAVYVLNCTPSPNNEGNAIFALRRDVHAITQAGIDLNKNTLGYDPTKYRAAKAANECDRIYYVGESNDVVTRMAKHRDGAGVGGPGFTNLVRPNSVVKVKWCVEDEAKDLENQWIKKLNQRENTFAFGS